MNRGHRKKTRSDAAVVSELYKVMLKIRLAELRIAEIYPSDKIQSPVHLSIGQEAVSAGVCLALKKTDRLYGTYRSHGIYIAKGGDLKKMFAELYAKDTGCARGRGGSMHLVAPEVGLIGCSAIVASTIPVAAGDALASRYLGQKSVTVAFFGDGALDEGVFYESLNFAALKNIPVIFVCENNGLAVYSKLSARRKNMDLHQYGKPFGIRGSRHDGNDAFGVFDVMSKAVEKSRSGGPPVLLEFTTYRMRDHVGPGEDHGEPYRDKRELAAAKKNDPLLKARQVLKKKFGVPEKTFSEWERKIRAEIDAAVEFAETSPFPETGRLYEGTFKNSEDTQKGKMIESPPLPERSSSPARGEGKLITYARALRDGLDQAMRHDDSVIVMGIGADDHKAIFGSTEGLVQKYGPARVFDTPLSEAAMSGVAVGAALGGLKPVHVHIRMDFLYLAMDQLLNLAAKWHAMFGESASVPMVVRAVIGRSWGQGAQHSQSLQSLFMHVPGIKVVMPTTPYDAKGLLMGAIADPNPVLVIEHRLLYYLTGEVPESPYTLELGPAVVRRKGKDITIIANSYMVVEALKAAAFLQERSIDAEIVDPVCLAPLDRKTILDSIRKTGKLLVVDASWITCGASAEIAAIAAEEAFDALTVPVRRMGSAPATCPVSKPLEQEFYPNAKKIVAEVYAMLGKKPTESSLNVPALTSAFKGPF